MKIHIIGGPGKRSSNRNSIGSALAGAPGTLFLKENHPVIAAVILAALAVLPAVGLAQRQHLRKQGIVSPWVFPSFTGKQENPTKFYRDWKRYAECNAIDERISFHCLRHTMISLYKDEVPEQLLKQVVGHSATMDTFGQYGHALADDAARTATLMDAAFTRYVK